MRKNEKGDYTFMHFCTPNDKEQREREREMPGDSTAGA